MTGCLLLPVLAGAAFKCAVRMDPLVATSGDGKTTVVVMMEGKVLVYERGQKKPRSVAKWDRFGHHLQLIVSQDASDIALVDGYAGMEVLDGKGKRKLLLSPAQLLSKEELANTPGKWTCHPEGVWTEAAHPEFSGNSVTVTTYSGRKAVFEYRPHAAAR